MSATRRRGTPPAEPVEAPSTLEAALRALEASERERAEVLIENARLFSELHERLEEQTATSLVLEVISRSPTDLQTVLDTIAESAGRLCATESVLITLRDGDALHTVAGRTPIRRRITLISEQGRGRLDRNSYPVARAIVDQEVVHIADLAAVPVEELQAPILRAQGVRTCLAVPLLRAGNAIGAIIALRKEVQPFTERQIALVRTFADQAVIAIENARLFSDLNAANATLNEALEEQRATGRVLEVISRSPTDLQTILDTIAESAARLCGADRASIALVRGTGAPVVAMSGAAASRPTLTDPHGGGPLTRTAGSYGRAILDREVVHFPDLADVPLDVLAAQGLRAAGVRSVLTVPMLRQDQAIGAISVQRMEVRPFTERQIALIRTFADQAVIAIENSRLFQELQDSNATLKEALEQQTVTAEVLRVISASPADLDGVLREIAAGAGRLFDSANVVLRLRDGDDLALRALHRKESLPVPGLRARQRVPRSPEEPAWLAMAQARSLHLEDVRAQYPNSQLARAGFTRTSLYTPLIRHGEAIGVMQIGLDEVRPFTPEQIRLVETFADQAVIAVENSRLFSELRDRDERRRQELDRASEIQRRLLPARAHGWPGMLELAHRFRPAVETSGDFFDVLPLPARSGGPEPLQVAVGDVAGKGMAAALVTALARAALRSTAAVPTALATPANTLRLAGQRLHEDVGAGHFVACALAVVEPPGRHHAGPLLRLANAAQVPVLLVRDGRATEIEPPGYRLPLGAEEDGAYEDTKTELQPGDVVVFSSDGLVEAPALPSAAPPPHLAPPHTARELFGFARLAASASHWAANASSAEETAARIWADLTSWCGDQSHHDDMTLLVLRVPHAASAAEVI